MSRTRLPPVFVSHKFREMLIGQNDVREILCKPLIEKLVARISQEDLRVFVNGFVQCSAELCIRWQVNRVRPPVIEPTDLLSRFRRLYPSSLCFILQIRLSRMDYESPRIAQVRGLPTLGSLLC